MGFISRCKRKLMDRAVSKKTVVGRKGITFVPYLRSHYSNYVIEYDKVYWCGIVVGYTAERIVSDYSTEYYYCYLTEWYPTSTTLQEQDWFALQ